MRTEETIDSIIQSDNIDQIMEDMRNLALKSEFSDHLESRESAKKTLHKRYDGVIVGTSHDEYNIYVHALIDNIISRYKVGETPQEYKPKVIEFK